MARDYHVTPSEIAFVNQLEAGEDLSSTDSLIIPVPPASSSKSRLTLYKVAHGDTLVTVADRFNITVQQLRRWNHLSAAHLEPGRRLYVAEPARVTRSSRSSAKHRVSAASKAQIAVAHIVRNACQREEWKRNLILTCVHWHPVACCCYNPRRRQV